MDRWKRVPLALGPKVGCCSRSVNGRSRGHSGKFRAKGLSQEAFAAGCGIERGERNAALRNIELIARTLGITLSELMKSV